MISRNNGLLSLNFLIPILGLLFSIIFVGMIYSTTIRPRAAEMEITDRLLAAQGATTSSQAGRSVFVILKNTEQQIASTFFFWATIILAYKLWQVIQERKLLRQNFVQIHQGERIIPDDALDYYKDLKSGVEREAGWRERLLPEFVLSALHRFHATHSVQDAASAIKEHAEVAADSLDSDLSLVRYIAWAIPAIGFIGTVRGIGNALAQADEAIRGDLSGVTSSLGLAFNSTLVALILSAILMFMVHMLQSRQEGLILEIQTYCREKLLAVMKVPSRDESSVLMS